MDDVTAHSGPLSPASSTSAESQEDRKALRAELDELNERLRVLESASISARSYIEAWVAFVLGGVAGKLLVDTFGDPTADGFPWHALPFIIAFLLVLGDVVRLRRKLRAVREEENRGLSRQRELRTLLGLDEIRFPTDINGGQTLP